MSKTKTVGHAVEIPALDGRVEHAHELCVAAIRNHPNGMIPIQSVYEMLLTVIGREDVIDAIEEDWQRLLNDEGESR